MKTGISLTGQANQLVFFKAFFFGSSDGFYRYGVIGCHWFCLCVVAVIFVHYVKEMFVNSVFKVFFHAMVHFFDNDMRKKTNYFQ